MAVYAWGASCLLRASFREELPASLSKVVNREFKVHLIILELPAILTTLAYAKI